MKKIIKNNFRRFFPTTFQRYIAYRYLIRNQNSYLYLTGWIESIKEQKPVDKDGNPLPWMNFPVVKFLEERLQSNLNLFEFGSGYSTLFYASRTKNVTSVEHNKKWFSYVKSQMPENVKILLKENDTDGDYCRAILSEGEQYDVVIVDGGDRVNCIKQCIFALSPKGVIVLDDSQRDNYQEGIEFAKSKGFKILHIEGLKALGLDIERTTVFYRSENCFDM